MAWTVRYVSVAGGGAHDGTSAANAWTLAEAIAGVAAGMQINIIAGTYANTTTSRAFATAGTTTAPIWWRGYKTTIGDLDDGVTVTPRTLQDAATLPLITFTTGQVTVAGAYQFFSNLDITSACTTAGGAWYATGASFNMTRCRIENTANHTAARAIQCDGTGNRLVHCRFKSHTGANLTVSIGGQTVIYACHIIGGGTVASLDISVVTTSINLVIEGFTTTGIRITATTGTVVVSNCTIYSAATNCITLTGTMTTLIVGIANCILGGCTNGINVTTASFNVTQFRNHFYSCTNNLVNCSELATFDAELGILYSLIDDDTDPFVAKASNDFTLAAAAIDKSAGFPGIFEGQTAMVGYPDIGAVRHVDPTAGGGLRLAGRGGLAS